MPTVPRRFLVTGGAGFLGANMAAEVLARGESLAIIDNLSRTGARENLEWLHERGEFEFHHLDVRDATGVNVVLRDFDPDVVFHLAGQVAMTTSIEDPRSDFEINAVGSFNVLEGVREFCPDAVVVYSSTNKVYGDLSQVSYEEQATRWVASQYEDGFDEGLPLSFHGPYGCSKGAADQYMIDFSRVYGLRTVVFRHSSIFGERQFSTYDQGWIGWFISEALARRRGVETGPLDVSGDGKQVRDVLFAPDAVRCYFSAVDHIDRTSGEVFNIGGGMANSLSLLELFAILEDELDVELAVRHRNWRAGDQKVFVANIAKAKKLLDWKPRVAAGDGVRKMLEWMASCG